MSLKKCECDTPIPWEDNKGRQTNVCSECGGKIEDHPLPELGSLHTRLDSILLGALKLDPDHPFITYLRESVEEDIRQKFLTWQYNRAREERGTN